VLLLDTSSIFFRAFHALPPMNTRAGEPTSAMYGMSTLLLKLLREEKPPGIAFALDAPVATFRHEAYEAYKAQRPPLPDTLRPQFARLDELLEALAVPTFRAPGYEADDVLATLAREIRVDGSSVRVVSGDRDLFQLAREGVDVLFIGRRGEKPVVMDAAAIETRFGVPPARLPSYVALVGDPSDNLPGVLGIGARTARKLVTEYGDATGMLSHLHAIRPDRVRAALESAREAVVLHERLARLRDDAPLPDGARHAAPSTAALARLRELFVKLEFESLLGRVDRLLAESG
jgi:DNA polymerase-1